MILGGDGIQRLFALSIGLRLFADVLAISASPYLLVFSTINKSLRVRKMAFQIYSANLQRLLVRCNRGTMFAQIYGWFTDGFDISLASRASPGRSSRVE